MVWPWGGTPDAPDFSRYDDDPFAAAEAVIRLLAEHGCVDSGILRVERWNPRTGEVGHTSERPRFEETGQQRAAGGLRSLVTFDPPDYENDWVLRLTVSA